MKASIPKGTRDFLPKQMAERNYIFSTAKSVFERFGFAQIETPAVENLSTLTGKYGDEGDQLMFKILNRGDKYKKALKNADENSPESDFAELALKYDQTVPFARFVVQNQNELSFPFKRYQIQPVWRADRPGKGRYREFYQCDVDVVGSDSLLCEVEFIQIFCEVLNELKVPSYTIKMNNRKVLAGIAEVIGAEDKIVDITVSIDKLDKIGEEKVKEEMSLKGVSAEAIQKIAPLFTISGSFDQKLKSLTEMLSGSEMGMEGVAELMEIYEMSAELGVADNLDLDVTLARGLNYYTGAIFEVGAEGFKGSICGGGRYDGLTDQFGLKGMGCVGISFGADRIYDLLKENDLFPSNLGSGLDVMITNFGKEEQKYALKVLKSLRSNGLNAELYPSKAKMKKQMSYAHDKAVSHVLLIGEDEIAAGTVTAKNMESGEQYSVTVDDFIARIKG